MTLHGTIQNGIVVLDGQPNLPNGTPVTVVIEQTAHRAASPPADRLTDEELQRRKAILDEISSLPNENPGDTFSGADHDKVLYGEP